MEKEALKKIIEDQQESLNKWKSKGRRFKGKGKGNKAAQAGSAKGKVQFQGKKPNSIVMMNVMKRVHLEQ